MQQFSMRGQEQTGAGYDTCYQLAAAYDTCYQPTARPDTSAPTHSLTPAACYNPTPVYDTCYQLAGAYDAPLVNYGTSYQQSANVSTGSRVPTIQTQQLYEQHPTRLLQQPLHQKQQPLHSMQQPLQQLQQPFQPHAPLYWPEQPIQPSFYQMHQMQNDTLHHNTTLQPDGTLWSPYSQPLRNGTVSDWYTPYNGMQAPSLLGSTLPNSAPSCNNSNNVATGSESCFKLNETNTTAVQCPLGDTNSQPSNLLIIDDQNIAQPVPQRHDGDRSCIARPRGRPPSGKRWDQERGQWVVKGQQRGQWVGDQQQGQWVGGRLRQTEALQPAKRQRLAVQQDGGDSEYSRSTHVMEPPLDARCVLCKKQDEKSTAFRFVQPPFIDADRSILWVHQQWCHSQCSYDTQSDA